MTPPKTLSTDRASASLRPARVDDGAAVWELVRDDGTLDLNSPYAYLLAFRHYGRTSVVADDDGRVVGFVVAYRPPEQPNTVFVWQVGVAASHRRQGMGGRLLLGVLQQEGCEDVEYMEATVTPSNEASMALFRRVARDLDAPFEVSEGFRAEHFPDGQAHEQEDLVTIGPFKARSTSSIPSTEDSAP